MDALQALGFTDYEARAYAALVEHGDLNGYELAKASGIPRANIYAVLDKLVQRGAAHRLQRTDGQRYAALEPQQLLRSTQTAHQRAVDAAETALTRLQQRRAPQAVFNLHGAELLSKARQVIDAAAQTLLVAIGPTEAGALAEPLRRARERGVDITTLCVEACAKECGGCQGHIKRYALSTAGEPRRLVLVADARTALIGELDDASTTAVLTEHPLVAELASAYIWQVQALALLGDELEGQLEQMLAVSTRQSLDRLCPSGDFVGFVHNLSAATPSSR